MDLGLGSEFAGYRIESVLGRGGMGVVYLAEHLGLGRKVALKVLAPDFAADERFRERFVRESRLAASLEHPNIVPIHEAGEVDGALYIAMRYVEGTDLRALLGKDGALEPQRAATIVSQVAGALDAAHARGLVHRDVKPGNVLIVKEVGSTAGEHVYLADFGLTKRTSSDSGITGTGQFVGTLDYAAPEQFEGKPLDARTDVYSLGCLLYECLTGKPPFPHESDASLMYAHLTQQAPAPTSLRPALPKGIDPIVARAMAKKPANRYEAAGAFAADVRRELAPADGPGGPMPRRGSRTVAAAGAALGVIVIAIVVAQSLAGAGSDAPGPGASPSPTVVGPPLGSVVEIDPSTGTIVSTVTDLDLNVLTGFWPAMAVGEGGVWVLDRSSVTHIDPESGTVEGTIPYQGAERFRYARAIDVGLGALAITDLGESPVPVVGAIARIDPATDRIRTFELPSVGAPRGLAIGGGAIWETFGCFASIQIPEVLPECPRPGAVLLRIDPRTFEVEGRFNIGGTVHASLLDFSLSLDTVVVGDDVVWVSESADSKIWFVDPQTGEVSEPIEMNASDGLAADGGSVWVLDRDLGNVTQVDRLSGIVETIRLGDDPTDMAAGLGALWVADGQGALWRVDLRTHQVTSIEIGSPLASIAIDEPRGTVWALVFE